MKNDIEKIFSPNNFFDLNNDAARSIFAGVNLVWQILPNLGSYLEDLFKKGKVKGNYNGRPDVFIGEGTVIQEEVKIVGPAVVGRNCFIGHAALLRSNCLLLDNVHIGHAVEVKNSIVMSNSVLAHLNYVGDSVLGSNVNVSGGAIFANQRLDRKIVSVKKAGEKIDTGLAKFSSIVGDGSFIGVNSVLNPGTVLGKNCLVYPLVSLSGFYDGDSVIK